MAFMGIFFGPDRRTVPIIDMFRSKGSFLPCSPDEQRRIVNELEVEALANRKEGDRYYIVSGIWWGNWKNYVESYILKEPKITFDIKEESNLPRRPGQIDNTKLIEKEIKVEGQDYIKKFDARVSLEGQEFVIKRNLMEGQDYILVHEEVWKKLCEWYKGGPPLPRKLISNQGLYRKSWMVEVHPISLKLIDARDHSQRIILISQKESVGELYNMICHQLKLDQSRVCIWNNFDARKIVLDNDNQTIDDALFMDQEILLEVQSEGPSASCSGTDLSGTALTSVTIEPTRSSFTIAGGSALSNGVSKNHEPNMLHGDSLCTKTNRDCSPSTVTTVYDNKSLTGLQNLGNTCFMNSAIQCLVHTPLVEYFLSDYTDEINKKNPLGMQGQLVVAFGNLLRNIWTYGCTPVAPRAFKSKLALSAPQFSGFNQHDSQELLAFLLDGLHEDLNRVKNKPYIQLKDANDQPDKDFAMECWENHKARNDSIIVDTCQGQYKSTLVCPRCSKFSVIFDPFISLPMPWPVTVPKSRRCRDLTQTLSTSCRLESDKTILLAEVCEHRICRYFENPSELLSSIKNDQLIVAYILPRNHGKLQRVEIMHRKGNSDQKSSSNQRHIGTPLVTCLVEGSHDRADYQVSVETVLKPLVRRNFLSSSSEGSKHNNVNGYNSDLRGQLFPMDEDMTSSSTNESEENRLPSFQLSLTDDNVIKSTDFGNDNICNKSCVRLLMDWSRRENDFYDFSYLDNLPKVCKSVFSLKKTRQESITLFSCLDAFLKEEPLGPDDMWFCPNCKKHRQATKKLDLWKLPDILVIHLKRFSHSKYFKTKLDSLVNFSLHNLDLSHYLEHTLPISHL